MSAPDIATVTEQLSKATVESEHELSFAGQGLKLDSEADAANIVKAINDCQVLTSLRMDGNTLGVMAAKAISKALEKHTEFERARWSDMFTGRLKSEIPQALRYLGGAIMLAEIKLVELDLSDNAFGPNGMEGLTELLKSKSCFSLQELRLNNNGLGITGGKMLAKSLLECHRSSQAAGQPLSLRVFISGRNRLENEGAIALSEAFQAICTLEDVTMPQNGINHEGITALAEAFSKNLNLSTINLNDNTFTEIGAKAMAQALPRLQQLEVLNFGDCLVRTDGAKALADALRDRHENLKELYLGFNEIHKSGGMAVVESVENKTNLVKLELDGNQFGEEGVELIRGSLEAIGKETVLGSLSDDEGSDDDDSDEDDEEEDGEEEEEEEEAGELVIDEELQVKGTAISPRKDLVVSAVDFLQFPSATKLLALKPTPKDAILEEIKADIGSVEKTVQAFIKVSSVVTKGNEEVEKAAFDITDELFSKVLNSEEENTPALVVNTILVYLGLMKSEEKVKPASDISGPLVVLEHVVRQEYFPKTAVEILTIFMSLPSEKYYTCANARTDLLQTLARL